MNDSKPSTSPPASPLPGESPLENKVHDHTEGLKLDDLGEEAADRRLAEIEMIGEEAAVGWKPSRHQPLAPEVRYLHISRTINQLITDRNRSVGIFLGMASLLFAASTALLNARPDIVPIIPLKRIQYWCLPVTFGTLAVIGVFMCLILVRTRVGLIYEVAKMNALLGLPSERVKRVNPFSIFFLMYLMVTMLASACAGLTVGCLVPGASAPPAGAKDQLQEIAVEAASGETGVIVGLIVAVVYTLVFLGSYYGLVLNATTDSKLDKARS